MTPEEVELSRRVAYAMHVGKPSIEERARIIAAAEDSESWDDLPPDIRTKLTVWEKRS